MWGIMISGFVCFVLGMWVCGTFIGGQVRDLENYIEKLADRLAEKDECNRLLGEELKKYAPQKTDTRKKTTGKKPRSIKPHKEELAGLRLDVMGIKRPKETAAS